MRQVKAGLTNQSVTFRFLDSTDGTPELGMTDATSGLAIWYRREGGLKVAPTPAALAALNTAHTDGGFEEIADGYYRVDMPDAAFASGVKEVMFGGACTGMVCIGEKVQIVAFDPDVATNLGMSALPTASPNAAGGLLITNAGTLDVDVAMAAAVAVNTQVGTAGVSLTNLGGMSTTMKAQVNTEADTALTDYDPPTRAEMDTAHGLLATPAQVATALTDIHLDHLLAADYDPASPPGTSTALLNELIESNAGVSRYTAAALVNAPSGTGASAATIADAVWDELQADHVIADSFGVVATEIAAIPTTAMRGTDNAALASEVTSARMGALTDWIDGGRLDVLLDAIPTTAMRGTDNAATAAVCTETRLAELDAANLPTDVALAALQAAADAALVANHLDHVFKTTYDPAAKPGAADALFNEIIEDDGGISRFSTNALEQGPSGAGSTAYKVLGDCVQDANGNFGWTAWCEKNGAPQTAATNCVIQLYKIDGAGDVTAIAGATQTVAATDTQGAFSEDLAGVTIEAGVEHYIYVDITVDAASRYGFIPFKAPVRVTS